MRALLDRPLSRGRRNVQRAAEPGCWSSLYRVLQSIRISSCPQAGIQLEGMLEKDRSRCRITSLQPDRAAKVAHQRWVDVGSPTPQEIERPIPLAPSFGLNGFV